MPSSQYIYDRFVELDAKLDKAQERARSIEQMAQKAERQLLQGQCAANGHILTGGAYYFGIARVCAVCGALDPAVQAAQTASENMGKAC